MLIVTTLQCGVLSKFVYEKSELEAECNLVKSQSYQ